MTMLATEIVNWPVQVTKLSHTVTILYELCQFTSIMTFAQKYIGFFKSDPYIRKLRNIEFMHICYAQLLHSSYRIEPRDAQCIVVLQLSILLTDDRQ